MKLTVELFGAPRLQVGAPGISVELPVGASLRELLVALAQEEPRLVGRVIAASRNRLVEPYSFYIEGAGFVGDLNTRLHESSRVVLMLASIGG